MMRIDRIDSSREVIAIIANWLKKIIGGETRYQSKTCTGGNVNRGVGPKTNHVPRYIGHQLPIADAFA